MDLDRAAHMGLIWIGREACPPEVQRPVSQPHALSIIAASAQSCRFLAPTEPCRSTGRLYNANWAENGYRTESLGTEVSNSATFGLAASGRFRMAVWQFRQIIHQAPGSDVDVCGNRDLLLQRGHHLGQGDVLHGERVHEERVHGGELRFRLHLPSAQVLHLPGLRSAPELPEAMNKDICYRDIQIQA